MPHTSSKSNENTYSDKNQSDSPKSTPSTVQQGGNKQTNKSDNKQSNQR